MRRDQLPPHKTATYVMRRWQAVYVSVNKAACTSLKWLVADLQGESRERFHRSLSREISRTMTIHRRSLWQHTPMAARLPDDELAAISPDTGWFIFAAVRHPGARIFSAWQSKLLLREPWWVEQFGDQPWFPRIPETTGEMVEDFLRFVDAMAADPDQEIMRNRHFAPQHRLLVPDRMPYTRIYKTGEMWQLLEDFERHLRGLGWDGELTLPRANETPLRPLAAFFPDGIEPHLRRLYADDLEAFGFPGVVPDKLEPGDAYPESAIAEIHRLIERAERINDLAMRARHFKRASEEKAERQPAPTPSIAARARRRLARGAR